jgi:hypothetical protein
MLFGYNPLGAPVLSTKLSYKTESGETKLVATPGVATGNINGGALAYVSQGILALYTPPTSTYQYIAHFGEDTGLFPKSAYAQVTGAGANVINPVEKLWKVTSNIAYMAFILVFIAAGVMIMFRQKLNPQTVIGIQQALPGIVVSLILVYFSYFIAAFIVDFAFIGTRVVAEIFISSEADNYFSPIETHYNNSDAFNMYGSAATRVQNVSDVFLQSWGTFSPKDPIISLPQSPLELLGRSWQAAAGAVIGAGATILLPAGFLLAPLASSAGLIGGFLFNTQTAAQAGTAAVVAVSASLLIPIILAIALMIQYIRLIIALIMSYLQILIMVIFGPFLILFSAIPGRGEALTMWWKSLLANALVFPAVFAGFLFAGMILSWPGLGSDNSTMPLFGGLSGNLIKSLLAFGILLGLPSIPEQVRNALGVKGPQGFTQAAIGGFMGGVGGIKRGYNEGMQRSGLQARKEAMEKEKLETQAEKFRAANSRTWFDRNVLNRAPSGRQ